MKWQDFLGEAQDIVAATKAEYPGAEGVVCVGGGSSSGKFLRQGTSHVDSYYTVPGNVTDMVNNNVANAQSDPSLFADQLTLFRNLMSATAEAQPGYSNLSTVAGRDPTTFDGQTALQGVARRDPYGGAYEAQTESAYRQRAADALAMAESGPEAVRGGMARGGLAQGVMAERLAQGRGQEVRQAQQQDVGNVMQAAGGLAGIEGQRTNQVLQAIAGMTGIADSVGNRGLAAGKQLDFNKLNNLQLLQLAASLTGSQTQRTTDDLSGRGNQSGMQAGCCFIFLQALNGTLPWYIELARWDYLTPNRRRGYKWMASWLVPAMRRSTRVTWFVNAVLIKPFLRYGAWLYRDKSAKRSSAILTPYCNFWLALWGGLGKVVKDVSKST